MGSSIENVGNWLEIDAGAFESNVRDVLSMIDSRHSWIHLDINSSGMSRHSIDVSTALGRASAAGIILTGAEDM